MSTGILNPASCGILDQCDTTSHFQVPTDSLRTTSTHESLHVENEATGTKHHSQALQRQVLRAVVSAMPVELLRAIFKQLVLQFQEAAELDRFLVPNSYDAERLCMPFRLAAVCRIWKLVCMDFSDLWAYIGISGNEVDIEENGYRYIMRTNLLLERSKSSPLFLYLRCPEGYDSTRSHWFRNILDGLIDDIHRWKDVTIILSNPVDEDAVAFLCNPIPLLEYLVIQPSVRTPYSLPWTSPMYLPYSPRIHSLEFWTAFFMPLAPLTSLVIFHVTVECKSNTYALLPDLLEKLPNLADLSIHFIEIPESNPLVKVISLPSLTRLRLLGTIDVFTEWVNYLEIPCLSVLVLHIESYELLESSMPFILAKCSSITDLHLHNTDRFGERVEVYDACFIPLITRFSRLQVLQLHYWTITDETFFSALSSHIYAGASTRSNSPVLPNFRSIVLDNVCFTPIAADALCDLVRKWLHTAEKGQFTVKIFNPLNFDHVWAERQLRGLLGDAFTISSQECYSALLRPSHSPITIQANLVDAASSPNLYISGHGTEDEREINTNSSDSESLYYDDSQDIYAQ